MSPSEKTPGEMLCDLWSGCAGTWPLVEVDDQERWERLAVEIAGNVPPLSIGSTIWPGVGKLGEECAEVGQIVGKLIAFPSGDIPDGGLPLPFRLASELGDLLAAIDFVRDVNDLDEERINAQRKLKLARFHFWHRKAREQ